MYVDDTVWQHKGESCGLISFYYSFIGNSSKNNYCTKLKEKNEFVLSVFSPGNINWPNLKS